MKVSDVMQKNVEFITPESSILEASRLIFGRGINGLPVLKDKKVVGFITERDILAKFYPTIEEYVDDPFHSSDFEEMESRVSEVLEMCVDKIMTGKPVVVTADTPLLRAQSLMFIEKIGRLPVVDDNGKLLGILSKGDIFRAVVGQKIPFEQDEKFHDWLSKKYDTIIDQKARLDMEIPDLVSMFKELNVKTVLDIGSGTGVHSIALAQKGFDVLGMDRSSGMIRVAQEKAKALPANIRSKIKFISKDYVDLEKTLGRKFDAVIFMGSALAHIEDPQKTLQAVNEVLNDKAAIICQISNYHKVMEVNKRFFAFDIRKSPYIEEKEQAFLRFFDEEQDGYLTQNLSIFGRGSKKWIFKGLRSMRVYPLTKLKITAFLKKVKFSNIKYYGGDKGYFYDYLFRKPFKEEESDVLTVVAQR